jgi:hypothetical protein
MSNNRIQKRQRRGEGGLRLKNGKWEGTMTIYKKNGESFIKSFTRNSINEINDIKAEIRVLGTVDDNVKDIRIDKRTNKVTLVLKGQSKNNIEISKDILVKDYVDYYIFEHRKKGLKGRKIEDTTLVAYTDKAKYIKQYIGDRKVKELTYEDIEQFINNLHKKTCDTTTKQTRDIITNMMEFAYKDGITTENVLQNNKITLKECKGKKEKKIIQKEDIKIFTDYCKEHKYYDLLFILDTGVRASEMARYNLEQYRF